MVKNNTSVLSKVHAVWHIIHASIAQYCPRCGNKMLYLGETCNLNNNGFDWEYRCGCTDSILIIKEIINCDE
jgi:predicted RNA-binding Zn-ribbon protein involved in translation (DUF1610 family)